MPISAMILLNDLLCPSICLLFYVYWKFVGNEINWRVRSRANVPRAPGGCRHGDPAAWAQPSVGRGARPRAGPHLQQEGGLRSSATARGGWPWGLGAGPRVGGEDVCSPAERAPAVGPAHRCPSTLLDTGLRVTGSPLRRGERERGRRHPQPGVGEWAPHVPESPGQRSPSSRAASPRPETPAEGLSVHFGSPLHPLIRPVWGAWA